MKDNLGPLEITKGQKGASGLVQRVSQPRRPTAPDPGYDKES